MKFFLWVESEDRIGSPKKWMGYGWGTGLGTPRKNEWAPDRGPCVLRAPQSARLGLFITLISGWLRLWD